jgi:hypothetical protein
MQLSLAQSALVVHGLPLVRPQPPHSIMQQASAIVETAAF